MALNPKRVCAIALFGATMPLAVASAYASDCDAVLFGIYSTTVWQNTSESYNHFLSALDQYNVSSYEEARSTASSLGIALPFDGVPVDLQLGHRSDRSGRGNWASQLKTRLENDSAARSQFIASTHSANADVVDAWRQ